MGKKATEFSSLFGYIRSICVFAIVETVAEETRENIRKQNNVPASEKFLQRLQKNFEGRIYVGEAEDI
jgi:hypothetical protein